MQSRRASFRSGEGFATVAAGRRRDVSHGGTQRTVCLRLDVDRLQNVGILCPPYVICQVNIHLISISTTLPFWLGFGR
jgi:hypothetical protein